MRKKGVNMKKIGLKILAVVVVIVILFSPYLLIDDFDRNAPFVFLIWFISVVYYLVMRRRVQKWLDLKNNKKDNEKREV
jgi:hypothetical protein